MKLTMKSINALPAPTRDISYFDDETVGFGLRCWPKPGGRIGRAFFVKYRNPQGRTRRLTIGAFGTWTPDQAREEAKRLLRIVDTGGDPSQARQDEREAILIGELITEYFDKARRGLITGLRGKPLKSSTLDTDQGRARRHIVKLLGQKAARDLSKPDVTRFYEDVAAGKTAGTFKDGVKAKGLSIVKGGRGAARRTVAVLSSIMSYAVEQGYVAANPCIGVKTGKDDRRRFRLDADGYRAFGECIAAYETATDDPLQGWKFPAIARLLALTGLRRDEAVKLQWDEVRVSERCIRLHDSKNGARMIPLGRPAVALLESLVRRGQYVFPGILDADKPYGSLPKMWRHWIGREPSPQHMRHAYASAGFALGLSELTIAYLRGDATDKTTAAGYIHAPDETVLAAADKLANWIERSMSGTNNVVPLKMEMEDVG